MHDAWKAGPEKPCFPVTRAAAGSAERLISPQTSDESVLPEQELSDSGGRRSCARRKVRLWCSKPRALPPQTPGARNGATTGPLRAASSSRRPESLTPDLRRSAKPEQDPQVQRWLR